MEKIIKDTIHAKGIDISIYTTNFENEFISLTDIAKYRNEDDPRFVIQNWMRNRNTIEFLGVREELHNPNFNRMQFEAVRNEAGLNRFVMTPTKIYYYNGRFSLGDFGLVDFPDNDDFTKSDQGLGAIFTIAPEMKRNP